MNSFFKCDSALTQGFSWSIQQSSSAVEKMKIFFKGKNNSRKKGDHYNTNQINPYQQHKAHNNAPPWTQIIPKFTQDGGSQIFTLLSHENHIVCKFILAWLFFIILPKCLSCTKPKSHKAAVCGKKRLKQNLYLTNWIQTE